jgi:N-terminal domain of galactosyltransferase/N-terminal region of glycosyl transferase group 7
MFQSLTPSEAKKFPQGSPTILIPFRDNQAQDRAGQLKTFVSHMKRYHPDWTVLIIEQSDDNRKFNRGALLNVGARLAHKAGKDYVIFHDVDLIPLSPIVPYYTAFPEHPIHIGKAWTTKWSGESFLGGVMSMSIKDIRTSNGFPNMFWGWGGEDDSMRNRLKKHQIPVLQPTMRTGFRELQHVDTRTNPDWKNMRKWEDLKEDSGQHGYRDVKWKVLQQSEMSSNIHKFTVELK